MADSTIILFWIVICAGVPLCVAIFLMIRCFLDLSKDSFKRGMLKISGIVLSLALLPWIIFLMFGMLSDMPRGSFGASPFGLFIAALNGSIFFVGLPLTIIYGIARFFKRRSYYLSNKVTRKEKIIGAVFVIIAALFFMTVYILFIS